MNSIARLFDFQENDVRILVLDNEPWFVATDIAKIFEYADPSKMLNLLDGEDKKIVNPHKMDGVILAGTFNSNAFKASLVNKSGLKKILARTTKIPFRQKELLLERLTGEKGSSFLKQDRIETSLINTIYNSFAHLSPVKQFFISGYRIDLYFPKEKIAVECDEYGHTNYGDDDEIQRQDIITKLLGCRFVRFNPHSRSFEIGQVINKLIKMIYIL